MHDIAPKPKIPEYKDAWKGTLTKLEQGCPIVFSLLSQVVDRSELLGGFADNSDIDGVTTTFDPLLSHDNKRLGWCEPSLLGNGKAYLPFKAPTSLNLFNSLSGYATNDQTDSRSLWAVSHERLHAIQHPNTPVELAEAQTWRTFSMEDANLSPVDMVSENASSYEERYKKRKIIDGREVWDYSDFSREKFKYGIDANDKLLALGCDLKTVAKVFAFHGPWVGDSYPFIDGAITFLRLKNHLSFDQLQEKVGEYREQYCRDLDSLTKIVRESWNKTFNA